MTKRKKRKSKKIHNLSYPTDNQKIGKLRENINQLQEKIDKHSNTIDAISKSHDLQISLLSNFIRHDLKNYIHSIDGTVSTYDADNISNEQIQSIKLNVNLMRKTLDDFPKLIVHSNDNTSTFDELIQAIRILNRDSFSDLAIDFVVNNPIRRDIVFHVPFISMLQLLNNLIVNAVKALEEKNTGRKIELITSMDSNNFKIRVCDNGGILEDNIKTQMFEYGFSTTKGSGIGLFHARYLCELYDGSIVCENPLNERLSKCFVITLPIIKDDAP